MVCWTVVTVVTVVTSVARLCNNNNNLRLVHCQELFADSIERELRPSNIDGLRSLEKVLGHCMVHTIDSLAPCGCQVSSMKVMIDSVLAIFNFHLPKQLLDIKFYSWEY